MNSPDLLIGDSLRPNKLYGMAGNNILVGGQGADTLDGSYGYDLLIGGHGADVLLGLDEDIPIGGYTLWDNSPAALRAISNHWSSPTLKYEDRVRNVIFGNAALAEEWSFQAFRTNRLF